MKQTTKQNSQTNGLVLPTLGPPVNPDNTQRMPSSWQCSVVLHPFSPPPADDPQTSPFFQLCTATITFMEGIVMSVQVTGSVYGQWWYMISPSGTTMNVNGNWVAVDMGWTMPTTQWLLQSTVVGSSFMNWMEAQMVDWWKMPVPVAGGGGVNASTWYWMNTAGANAGMPFRMMFGNPPASPTMGDPAQLAFFQNFSFTYFVNYTTTGVTIPSTWLDIPIPGFQFGNNPNYNVFVWNNNFGMTTFMTPANEAYNPLPTEVLYVWKDDADYQVVTDRAQHTQMWYDLNAPTDEIYEVALLYGRSAPGVPPPPNSGTGFLIDTFTDKKEECQPLPFAQEPPEWATPAYGDGAILACIQDNIELCPGNNIMILGVLFPSTPEYPQGTYLWTWYSPMDDGSDGLHSRPVTFMQSASTIGQGTSLALADYYDYIQFAEPIDPSNFDLPASCNNVKKKK
jgi:hypothetical protein